MSKRNTQANKAAARERLRAERERQAKKDKVRRQVIVGVSIVGVLAVVGGITWGVMQLNQPSGWEAAKDAKNVAAPKNTSGKNGTTVVIGKSTAKKTLELYEDSRCPVCGTFEQSIGETVHKDVDAGKYKIKYIGATFIDGMAAWRGLQERAERAGRRARCQPGGIPRLQGRALLREVPPGGDR